jgi:DNA repair exonuclease SbcCD ATPase subunit
MQINSICVDGVGKFGVRTEITGLGAGVNILSAGNEAGKSTVFRAVRACLFERHNSKNENLRSLATDGLSLPVTVTVGFELDGEQYAITKSFVKSPAASLVKSGVEIARGREADEKLWELIGVAPGSGRAVDESAFGLLWVGQGQSFSAPEPTEAATNVLTSAIQAEVGSLVGGERARAVLAGLKEELGALVTDTGRPKTGRPFADAATRLESIQQELTDSEARLSILDRQLTDLGAKRRERARLGDPALLQRMMTELAAAQESQKEAEEARARLERSSLAAQHSKNALDQAERHLTNLLERRDRIDDARRREQESQEALTPLQQRETAANEAIRNARDGISALDAQAARLDDQERALQGLGKVVARASTRPTMVDKEASLEGLGKRLKKNKSAMANNDVTAAVLTSLEGVEREIATLTARLEAAAPEVTVALGPAGRSKVSVDGSMIDDGIVRAAIDPMMIEVGELATVMVTPRTTAGAGDHQKRRNAQDRLTKLLKNAGVASADALRAARTAREALEAEAVGLQGELNALGIKEDSPAVALENIRAEIQAIDAQVSDALASLEAKELPSEEEIAQQQEALRGRREATRRERQALDGTLEAQNAVLSGISAARGRLQGTLTEVRNRLATDLAGLPDENRAKLIEEAEAAVGGAQADYRVKAAALEEQRQKTPSPEQVERRANRVKRLTEALSNHNDLLGRLDREIANLEGQIQSAGGDGLGEKVEELRQLQDLTQREVDKYRKRVETLQLLKSTIEACYTEQRDRLQAPLRRYLKPYLNDVFPSAELELGDGFTITGIMRNGRAAEGFERLSAGTQEQIAVLVRLAMGAMLCDRGHAVPIILDDALVFSDDHRIEQMFDALNRAGTKQQVIVLTCRSRAFALLGGRRLSIEARSSGH